MGRIHKAAHTAVGTWTAVARMPPLAPLSNGYDYALFRSRNTKCAVQREESNKRKRHAKEQKHRPAVSARRKRRSRVRRPRAAKPRRPCVTSPTTRHRVKARRTRREKSPMKPRAQHLACRPPLEAKTPAHCCNEPPTVVLSRNSRVAMQRATSERAAPRTTRSTRTSSSWPCSRPDMEWRVDLNALAY